MTQGQTSTAWYQRATGDLIRKQATFHTESDLGPEEVVALLFHIVVDNAGHFLLPDFKSVNTDVVLDVLKGPVEPIHGGGHVL